MASEPDLLIEAGFSDAKLAQETQKIIAKYNAMGDAAEKAFKGSEDAVSNNQKLKAHMRELDKLQTKFDPVYVATKKYERSVKELDAALSKGVIDQARYNAEVTKAQKQLHGLGEGVQQVARRSGVAGHQIQNVGYQVQDFAVQVSSGTSATRAFAQQFPQLASAFGPVGVAVGTLGAILIPLAGVMLGTAEKSQTLDEEMKALEKSTADMTSAAEAAKTPIEELRLTYGDLADEVSRANQAMAAITAATARRDALSAARRLGGELGDLPNLNAYLTSDGAVRKGYENAYAKGLAQGVAKLGKELGATEAQAKAVFAAINQLGRGTGPGDLVDEVDALSTALASITPATAQQQTALQAMADKVKPIMDSAIAQVAAGADESMAAQQKLIDTYDKNTQQLKGLATDRAAAEAALAQAVKDGNQEKIDSYTRVLKAIDSEVAAVKRAIADLDGSFDAFVTRMQGVGSRIGGALSSAIEGYTGWTPAQFVKDSEAAAKGILELIASRESGGDYNATLDNGAYTGGPRDLINMTLNEVLAMQKQMLSHPKNKHNSSAAGRYQIVSKTLAGLIADLGLTGNEMYDPAMQDRLALELVRRRRGQGIEGLRNEWEGLRNVSPAVINQALGAKAVPGEDPQVASERQKALEKENRERERKLELVNQYSAQLSKNLIDEQKQAELAAWRTEQISRINSDTSLDDTEKASAIAAVNAEMQKQVTIFALLEEAKRRNVDLDSLMVGSTLTYRQAIEALGETQKAKAIADQQAAAAMEDLARRQQFSADLQQQLKDGLVDAIVAGNDFADVLANVAQALAKAALQAALFGEGPFGGGGGGLLGSLFSGLFGGGDALAGALRGAGLSGVRSFAGGGYTWDGPRTGGLDGRGGKLAILHPKETVIDHTRNMGAGNGQDAHIRVSIDRNGNLQAFVDRRADAIAQHRVQQSDSKFVGRFARTQDQMQKRTN